MASSSSGRSMRPKVMKKYNDDNEAIAQALKRVEAERKAPIV